MIVYWTAKNVWQSLGKIVQIYNWKPMYSAH